MTAVRSAAWPLAVVAGVLVTFAPASAGLRTLSQRDGDRFFGPFRGLVDEALRQGRLPLWNPYEAGGKPLFAEGVHAVLHPVSLAGALLAPGSLDFLLLGYLLLAALGAQALGRALGTSRAAAAGAGLAFALSGYTVSMIGNQVFLAGLSALPWVLAAARAAGAGWRLGPAATALATACVFLAGDAQVALLGLALGALLAADAGGRGGLGRALAGLGAGVLLAGVQISTTAAFLPETLRGLPLPPGDLAKWALDPGRLVEWLVPGLLRGPLGEAPRLPSGEWIPTGFAESVYLGAPLLVAAALGAWRTAAAPSPSRPGLGASRRTALLLAGAAVALLWLALGHHLGARQALGWVPLWGRFRYPEKLMGPLTLVLCALGALGVEAFAAARLPAGWARALAAAGAALLAALLALRLAPGASGALAAALLGELGGHLRGTLAAGLPHAVLGLAALLAIDRLARGAARGALLALLLAVSAGAAAGYGAALGDPAARRAPPPPLEADGPGPRIVQVGAGGHGRGWGLDYVDAYARSLRALLGPSANVAARVDALDAYCAFGPRRFSELARALGPAGQRHLRRFGLTHVVVADDRDPAARERAAAVTAGGRLVARDEALGREVWAVPHRPWAFFAARAVAVDGPEAARRVLVDLLEDGDDGAVVLETAAAVATGPGRVLDVAREVERVRVEAESAGPALLVVQDAWWPGWRAAVDGQPVELIPADGLVRAVRWPGGRHRLELTYEAPGLRVGWWLSGAGAALLLGLAGWGARRRPAVGPVGPRAHGGS